MDLKYKGSINIMIEYKPINRCALLSIFEFDFNRLI